MILSGRIAGISGIFGGLLKPAEGDRAWRVAFIAGLVTGPLLIQLITGEQLAITIDSNIAMLLVGGLLVGFGTSLGAGCTSGHGVCGVSRFSVRSIVATGIFMLTGAATAFIIRHGLS